MVPIDFKRFRNLSFHTSFQKSSIDWPQQPPTEKVLNFNMIFHDSTKKFFFWKHGNKVEFKNLDDSEVLVSDFPDLAASVTSTASTTSVASMTLQLISSNKLLVLKVGTSLAPKWPIMVSFCGMYHQKSKFSLISTVEASQCYFFENWLMKLKCPNLQKPKNSKNVDPSTPQNHSVSLVSIWDTLYNQSFPRRLCITQ